MRFKEHLSVATNVAVLALVAFTLLRPTGPVGGKIAAWYQNYSARKIVAKIGRASCRERVCQYV